MYLDPQQWQHCENFFFYNNDLFSAKRAMGTESVSLPIEKNPCRGFCSAILSPDGPLTRTNIWRKYHQIRAGRKSLKCFRVCAHFQTASRLKSSLTFPQKISRIPGFASSYLLAFFSALDSRTPLLLWCLYPAPWLAVNIRVWREGGGHPISPPPHHAHVVYCYAVAKAWHNSQKCMGMPLGQCCMQGFRARARAAWSQRIWLEPVPSLWPSSGSTLYIC